MPRISSRTSALRSAWGGERKKLDSDLNSVLCRRSRKDREKGSRENRLKEVGIDLSRGAFIKAQRKDNRGKRGGIKTSEGYLYDAGEKKKTTLNWSKGGAPGFG